MPPIGYIAYIDEAGDDGLRRIKTADDRGASEWMVMSAILIKASREAEVLGWTKSIVGSLDQHQINHLHFRLLKDDKKTLVCSGIADLSVRIFVLLSHKKNMEGYRNIRAEKAKVNNTAWFYCWMSKLLLERVTAYCGRRAIKDYGEPRPIRIEFSDRGGVKIEDIKNYYRYIKWQSDHDMLYDKRFDLDWSVVNIDEIHSYPNKMRAGLQLADVAASAFFTGIEPTPAGTVNPDYAKLLLPRICQGANHRRYGFGVKMMPVWVPTLKDEPAWNLISFLMPR